MSDFLCRSVEAMMLGLPVSLRILFAFRASKTGRYDSGMRQRPGSVANAKKTMKAKTHLQLTLSPMKPLIGGASSGPQDVAHMKHAMATPLSRVSLYTSAYKPGTMAIGPEATMPARKRNTSNEGQFGATAHAMLKMMNSTKVPNIGRLRP